MQSCAHQASNRLATSGKSGLSSSGADEIRRSFVDQPAKSIPCAGDVARSLRIFRQRFEMNAATPKAPRQVEVMHVVLQRHVRRHAMIAKRDVAALLNKRRQSLHFFLNLAL